MKYLLQITKKNNIITEEYTKDNRWCIRSFRQISYEKTQIKVTPKKEKKTNIGIVLF